MAVGDVYQLGVNQTLYGVQLANIYSFEQLADTTPGTSPEDSLIQAFLEHLTPLQAAMSVIPWSTTCFTAIRVRPTGGVQFVVPAATPGLLTGEGNAVTTCCLASLYSSTVGPRGRGRKFFSGIPVTGNQFGRLSTASLALFTTFLDRLLLVIKWAADNAQFILRIISSVDAIIRDVVKYHQRVALTKQRSRLGRIC